ncbi:MAG: AAA family ATPase, partial [Alphaproteobacteria bacterium]|nr:AAA family ATPase [Alphaproteobacteria bacterium]
MSCDIGKWLDGLGLGRYAAAFVDNEIDLHALPHITDEDLKEIGVALGARRKLLAAIAGLGNVVEPAAADEKSDVRSAGVEAERRQLTVMFVDLVDSTALSERLDPEDLREVIRAYQGACAEAVGRYEGNIAKYIGDGLLVYFGYPQAHEDDARRAVMAGLGIIAGLETLNRRLGASHGVELSVRIGIHTGLVVVGEMGGGETREADAIVGRTPNVAARLEGLAEPNTVAISAATQRLVEGLFECDDLGPQELKGVSKPVRVFRVLGESAAPSRFEATAERGLTPLVGRGEEVDLLSKRWEQARNGESQVVLLSGEAGVCKSGIVRAVRERLEGEPHSR